MTNPTKTDLQSFERIAKLIRDGKVKWWALSVRTDDDVVIAVHSKDAPKRPRGLA